jgi:hypothetical protein
MSSNVMHALLERAQANASVEETLRVVFTNWTWMPSFV